MRYKFRGRAGLRTKTHLVQFWAQLTPSRRQAIVGRLGDMVESVLAAHDDHEPPVAHRLTLLASLVSLADNDNDDERRSVDVIDLAYSPATIAARRQPAKSSSLSSSSSSSTSSSASSSSASATSLALTTVVLMRRRPPPLGAVAAHATDAKLSHTEFVESLFFTPLLRAASPRDLVLRRIGQRLQVRWLAFVRFDRIFDQPCLFFFVSICDYFRQKIIYIDFFIIE